VETTAGYGKSAVLECPDDRFAGVLDYRSYRLCNRHSSLARIMGRTANNMRFSFGGTPMINGNEPLKFFSCSESSSRPAMTMTCQKVMGPYVTPKFLAGDAVLLRHLLALVLHAVGDGLRWENLLCLFSDPRAASCRRPDTF